MLSFAASVLFLYECVRVCERVTEREAVHLFFSSVPAFTISLSFQTNGMFVLIRCSKLNYRHFADFHSTASNYSSTW